MTLRQIIDRIKNPPTYNTREPYRLLESYCLRHTYRQVRENADREGVDLDELEELLQEIS